jgi:hypothetical protein
MVFSFKLLQLVNVQECLVFAVPLCLDLHMVQQCMMGNYGYLQVTMAMPGLMICGLSHCW